METSAKHQRQCSVQGLKPLERGFDVGAYLLIRNRRYYEGTVARDRCSG